MSVLMEILKWSQSRDRPVWQRDALRRLVLKGELSEDDIRELGEICKSAYGLAEQQDTIPLTRVHIPKDATSSAPVTLQSIYHHRGVNALAEGQTLKFTPSITLVYGDNAAGKTGYIRILKSACQARGKEDILGNVVSGRTPHTPSVEIKYTVGDDSDVREWTGQGEDDFISRVSVFDTQCSAVYLTEKTDVAYYPLGLDLFDKLVKACKDIRSNLESEQRALGTGDLSALQMQVPEGTAVAKLLENITSLTKPETVSGLAHLSPEEQAHLNLLEQSLKDLQANDPNKLARQLTLLSGRIRSLAQHLKGIEIGLSEDTVSKAFDARVECRKKSEEAKRLREATFPADILDGTGSETWSSLWDAARRYSEESAYPDQEFPAVENGAQCVLCQQDIEHAAGHRLKRFATSVASTTEQELRTAREKLTGLCVRFQDLHISAVDHEGTINEIRIENENMADAITDTLVKNEARRKAIVEAFTNDTDLASDCPALVLIASDTESLAEQLDRRIQVLGNRSNDEDKKRMTVEVQELQARKTLATHEQIVLNEIERKKMIAAYELCRKDTRTNAVTQKSTAVTKKFVTQKLKQQFQVELENLAFRHVEVELKEVGGTDGVLYHRLVLTRAPGVELSRVASEGEQRCLSIAAFFAELSTADDQSGIVFDDPVSSLDYKWRESVAQRLVMEAKTRQVIVFTHDIVFLLLLKQFAKEQQIEQLDQYVRNLTIGAGVCDEELPWVALPVKKKIGYLNKKWQDADKLYRDGHQSTYEKEAGYIYGLLREAWERALEEVLLSGVVERYRPGIQTQQVVKIADITEEDCRVLEAAMTKCSRWLPGHDQAPAARADIPEPDVLRTDIDTLDKWVVEIRDRR